MTWWRAFVCGLTRHDDMMVYGTDRLYLRCTCCGRETPGWDVVPLKVEVPA